MTTVTRDTRRTYHTACWMKTAKTQTSPNSVVTSGPKFCEGDYTTPSPGGDPDSMRVGGGNTIGNYLEITMC